MAIASRAYGANDTTVKLSDGTITKLSAFIASPGALTISAFARGAGNPTIKDSDGAIKSLAQHTQDTVNAAGTATVAQVTKTSGNNTVVDGNGKIQPISNYQALTDGVDIAVIEVSSEDDPEVDPQGIVQAVTKKTTAKKVKTVNISTKKATKIK